MSDETQNPNLSLLRSAESELLLAHLRPGMRVLELGGGNGFQAKLLHDHGCVVTSLDIPSRSAPVVQYFPVQSYDGTRIPAPEASFDAVFSASVLEHVRDLPALFTDLRRVLTPEGFMVHIVPSPVWRLWTSLARYPFLARELVQSGLSPAPGDTRGPLRRAASFLKTLLIEPPHGEYQSALVELYHYRHRSWSRLFERTGWSVVESYGNGLFYTGVSTFPNLSLATRRRLAKLLGSSCIVFVLRPKTAHEGR
jgi:ubiquinone/menaquinone biosynthesis C-methylase UbiE